MEIFYGVKYHKTKENNMTTQNNMTTLPTCLVMMIRKDATALSESMYQAPKKKMLQEELKRVLDMWGGEKYDEEYEEDGLEDLLEFDEDEGYDTQEVYMLWFEDALRDPWEDPCIKRAAKKVRRLEGEGYYEDGAKEKRVREVDEWMEAWKSKNGF